MRVFLATVAIAAATDAEPSAMLQVRSRSSLDVDSESQSEALSRLHQEVVAMLKVDTTPDVMAFSKAALDDIKATVKPAIDDAHAGDQLALNQMISLFKNPVDAFNKDLEKLQKMWAASTQTTKAHEMCRKAEKAKCDTNFKCEVDRVVLWEKYMKEDKEFDVIVSKRVAGECVVEGKNEHDKFATYQRSVQLDIEYKVEGEQMFAARKVHESKLTTCVTETSTHERTKSMCDKMLQKMVSSSCEAEGFRAMTVTKLQQQWAQLTKGYEIMVVDKKRQEKDRKTEWNTLTHVDCLLKNMYELGGKACGDKEAEKVLKKCSEADPDTHLNLKYPPVPPMPEAPKPRELPCEAEIEKLKSDKCFSGKFGPIAKSQGRHQEEIDLALEGCGKCIAAKPAKKITQKLVQED